VPLVQERLKRLTDVVEWTDFFFTDVEPPDLETLVPKGLDAEGTRVMLEQVRGVLADVAPFDAEQVEAALRGFTGETDYSNRQVLATLRWVVTAKKASPPLFGTIAALGKEATLERIEVSEQVLQGA
jgi:glutamyl-tRNA synthetase